MTKTALINNFTDNHQQFIKYITALTDEQFLHRYNQKWTAGQQLSHVFLCLLPFMKALPSKDYILQKFGKSARAAWDYETVIGNYFKTSLQAPEKFLPGEVGPEQKNILTADLGEIVASIGALLSDYTEEELDTLVLPHPLLGNLSIREMFYFMGYHALHHLKQTQQHLEH